MTRFIKDENYDLISLDRIKRITLWGRLVVAVINEEEPEEELKNCPPYAEFAILSRSETEKEAESQYWDLISRMRDQDVLI